MIEKNKLLEYLKKIDDEFVEYSDDASLICDDIEKMSMDNIIQKERAVLGLDIYKYSGYSEEKQKLIPFVFDLLLDETIKHVKQVEPTFFGNDYNKTLIPTGDGGFLLFETPLHALLFNLYFYSNLQFFNTGHFFPKLSKYIGEIIIRSAITLDNVFFYENNYFGKGIITNARILSKDRLNRFLIDKNVYNYFVKKVNGLETLPILTKNQIKKVFKTETEIISWFIYKEENLPEGKFYINDRIRNIHIQKIDNLFEKDTKLTLYNVEIQIVVDLVDERDRTKLVKFIISIGNTNALA